MRRLRFLIGLCFIINVVSAEDKLPLHMWKGTKGTNTISAAFVRISEKDPSRVVLRCKDGSEVSPKLSDLCEADQSYVEEVTYVPQDVAVVFKKKGRFGGGCAELGVSQCVTIRDTVSIQWVDDGEGQKAEPVGDSVWKIESVNVLDTPLSPRKEGAADKLETRGKFVLVAFEVRNTSKLPVRGVPPPVLFDKGGCPYTQYEKPRVDLHNYIPENVLLAGSDTLQPGMPQLFWAYYEMPLDAEPASVEVFPLKTRSDETERAEVKGKQMFLRKGIAKAEALKRPPPVTPNPADKNSAAVTVPSTPDPVLPGASDKKVNINLKATKTKQGGDTRSDYLKTRSYTYQVEMILLSSEVKQVPVTVKVFFTGAVTDRRDLVVDRQEKDVVLDQTKRWSEPFTSKEIRERRTFFYYSLASHRIPHGQPEKR